MSVDMSQITDIYSQYVKDTAATKTTTIDTSKDYSKATDEELMDACKEFEAYFLEQCFKEMMKTVGEDTTSSGSMSTLVDYYKDNMIQNVAKESTEQESLGLAQTLYEQMKRNYNL